MSNDSELATGGGSGSGSPGGEVDGWEVEDFITGDVPDLPKIALTIVSSAVLLLFGGLIAFLEGVGTAAALLYRTPLDWAGDTVSHAFETFADSLSGAWVGTAEMFPIAGPFDFVLAFIVVVLFLTAIEWVFQQAREGV